MKHRPLESHSERRKQRRVIESSDGYETIIGEVQVHEESEVVWPEGQGKVKGLQSQKDFMRMHGVPSSEVVNQETSGARWVMEEQGDSVKGRQVMKHFDSWKDENNEFLCRNTDSSPVQFGLGTGSKASDLVHSQNNCMSQMQPRRS